MAVWYDADLTDLDAASLALSFRVDGVDPHQVVNLSVTQPHLGDIYLWFLCPMTGWRARVLYLPERQARFASREAYRLSYRSQGETELFRQITKAQNIRFRLKGDLSIYTPFPPRPRGMHRRTYLHLRAKGLAIEGAALKALLAQEAALEHRLASLGQAPERRTKGSSA